METIKFKSRLDEVARKAYAEFEEKVQRTVFLNNLSPTVTSAVITKALNQFGDVVSVEFIPNYTIPYPIPQCALVEMKDPKQAGVVIALMDGHPFMIDLQYPGGSLSSVG
ncbi:uncharacterized protein A4U43_UnF1710 [Asparagus officinalis]|uniref:RRM domain-containing protein n=1 Tax=Asparagus officinalis TaxID=4686 RepID=A0A1R3L7H0_ASPOF|nr:uncharacterized protein A4U43_UnF1710 [Asparagus officinalis]